MEAKEKPLLSVVVPVFNTEKYLDKCVTSILNQTYPNLQIILVDDCSDDDSGLLCDQFASTYLNVKCIHKTKNEGPAYARRDGTAVSDGSYVTFVDSDDWIEPLMYDSLMQYVIDEGAEIVSSGALCENSDGKVVSKMIDPANSGIYHGKELEDLCNNLVYCPKYHSGLCIVSLALKIYKKDLLMPVFENIPAKMTYWEDLTYVFPPFFEANRVAVSDECYYHITYRCNSLTRRENDNMLPDLVNSLMVAANVYSKYNNKITNCFYQKAVQVIVEYLWEIPKRYPEWNKTIQKWVEVHDSETIVLFDKKCDEKNDDKLYRMVIKGFYSMAYIYYMFCRFEKPLEKRVKELIGYNK